MRAWFDVLNVRRLWRDVFGDDPPAGYYQLDLECEFVGRVHRELFPVELEVMDSMIDGDEDPLNLPIPISGYRIPWEYCPTDEIVDYMQPVAQALQDAREYEDMDQAPGWLHDNVDWDSVVAPALDALGAQGAPWDGLADLARLAIQPPSGNPWFDLPDSFWAMEFEYDGLEVPHYWEAHDVRELARFYAEARPTIERIEAYEQWFNRQPNGAAYAKVMEMLWQVDPGQDESEKSGTGLLVDIPELTSEAGELVDD